MHFFVDQINSWLKTSMDRSEPAFVPEWLNSSGSDTGGVTNQSGSFLRSGILRSSTCLFFIIKSMSVRSETHLLVCL